MKARLFLQALVIATSLLLVAQTAFAAGPTVDHRFYIELPDGSKADLKGAKIHKIYEETDGTQLLYSYCRYDGVDEVLQRDISPGYHCATNESCFVRDMGAPYLPAGFNADQRVYTFSDASYFTFNNRTFTDFLNEKIPYLATMYQPSNIRGFEGARWQGTVDYSHEQSDTSVSIPSNLDGSLITTNPNWGNIEGIAGKQSWSAGEVYLNTVGGNVLQGRITWVLKPPSEPAPEIPTAKFAQVCGPQEWNGPLSYNFTISEIDLKGQPFVESSIHIAARYDDKTAALFQYLGAPSFRPADWTPGQGELFYYQLRRFTPEDWAAASNQTLTFTWDSSIRIGGNQRTIDELSQWVTDNNFGNQLYIGANMRSGSGDRIAFNDFIGGFNIDVTKNACATAPAPMCLNVRLQDEDENILSPNDMQSLRPGDEVQLVCGPVANVSQYEFRVIEIPTTGGTPTTINLVPSTTSNISLVYTIPNSGRFIAQCRICPGGVCQEYDPIDTQPAPSPTPASAQPPVRQPVTNPQAPTE